jgi:hypothetical protein
MSSTRRPIAVEQAGLRLALRVAVALAAVEPAAKRLAAPKLRAIADSRLF